MIHTKLESHARNDQERSARVARWRLTPSLGNFGRYVLWRNRFPLINKILSRSIVLIEIYLFYHFFHFSLLTSVGAILFLGYLTRELFRGISQGFRLALIEEEARGGHPSSSHVLGLSLVAAASIGVAAAGISLGLALAFKISNFGLALLALALIVSPLEFVEQMLWSAIYTKKRLSRSFWLLSILRLTPAALLILAHQSLGPAAYVIGFAIARLGEHGYLITRALRELTRLDLSPKLPASPWKKLNGLLRIPRISSHVFAPLPFVAYELTVGALLLLRSEQYFITYFVILQLAALFGFLAARGPQSLAMDLFLALRSGDIASASLRWRQANRLLVYLLIITATILAALIYSSSSLLSLSSSLVYELPLYLLLELLTRTCFLGQLSLHRAIGTEIRAIKLQLVLFTFAALCQWQAILWYRVNLPAVLALDVSTMAIAAYSLIRTRRLASSRLFSLAMQSVFKFHAGLPAPLWLDHGQRLATATGSVALLLIAPLPRYLRTDLRNALIEEISNILPAQSAVIDICPGLWGFLVPGQADQVTNLYRKKILFELAGHLRTVTVIDPTLPVAEILKQILLSLTPVKYPVPKIKLLFSTLKTLLSDPRFAAYLRPLASERTQQFLPTLSSALKTFGIGLAPILARTDCGVVAVGDVRDDHLRISEACFSRTWRSTSLLPSIDKPYVVISVAGDPQAVIDGRGLAAPEAASLSALALALSIQWTARLIANHRLTTIIPEEVSDWRQGIAA